ncbi:MAG: N-6 DNA methylase [Candidatus Solibacter sp.]|nr:N-6 DNA methylase [Candidatus Solibacter sp.]
MTPTITQEQIEHRRQEVVQAIDNACDQMRSEGVQPHNYVEQLSWLFFLKAFDESESRREEEADFEGTKYQRLLDGDYRWSAWASKTNRADEMLGFVDKELWPHLRGLHDGPIAERLSRIFSTIKNHQTRGASFARVVTQVNKLHFSEKTDVDVLSEIYERLMKDVASVAGYAGEFYTPRHIIAAMVQVAQPRLGERVYDPCFGSGGFLWMAANEIRRHPGQMGREQLEQFHKRTIYGRELGPLAYLNGTMGLLLHDIREANLELVNTLEVHTSNVSERDKYSVILANPPYGGKLPQQVQTNFTVRSAATEVLFLQHIMANLAKGGRAAVIVPEGVLFRGGPDATVRQRLLREFNVHTILSLPPGLFLPYTGVKANVLFFSREDDGRGTESIWYYELTNDGFELKQTRKPVQGGQIQDFLEKQRTRTECERSWVARVADLKQLDLSAKNPNRKDDYEHRPALDLVQSMKAKQQRIAILLDEIEELLGQ